MLNIRPMRLWREMGTAFLLVLTFIGVALGLAQREALAADPNQGPGGPILVASSATSPFGKFYAEILRNEGLNAFAVADIGSLSAASLAAYDVLILPKMAVSPAQVTLLSDWVGAGGKLIAMDPDPLLYSLLGLTPAGSTLSEGYLVVDTANRIGNGIAAQSMQFHGTARLFTLNGASSLATLYSSANAATVYPAATLNAVGANGGKAAAFAFDLATSVVYTRQGNPLWAGQERDGSNPIRSDDQYFGLAAFDPQSDWVDLGKVTIPQADEQQRFLANLIHQLNLEKRPLPRFWYLPHGKKAAVVMTGDDHARGGTIGQFERFKAASPAGCSLNDWECVRSTSYIFVDTPLSPAEAAGYDAEGFEVGLHINTNCANFSAQTLEAFYSDQIAQFSAKYPSVLAPSTQRHHCIAWSNWATAPKVQVNHGIRLDTNYYYWPPGWVNNVPGHFTGSAMPMRFADLDGTLIDVYQVVTQMTDESGQVFPFTIDTLLDRALGPEQHFGVFTINAHTDFPDSPESIAVLNSALARNVPIVSARQMLNWLDGRNASSFAALSWAGNTASFSIVPGAGSNGLQAMVPLHSASGVLDSLTRGGSPVTFSTRAVKGIDFGFIPAVAGTYVATYVPDTTPPAILTTNPQNGANEVSVGERLSVGFSEAIDPATVTTATVVLRGSEGVDVPAAVTYDAETRSAVLIPNVALGFASTYTATVLGGAGGVKDLVGNPLPANYEWTFSTPAAAAGANTIWPATAAPTIVSAADSAAVELGVKFRADVSGFIRGIRFYKGAANTGTHIGNLWSSTGSLLATAQFSNETGSGWQQVDFAAPVAVTANTVYVASYHAPNGQYAADGGYFSAAGVNNGVLHALRDGESGGNGVYAYSGSSTFPSSTFNASNYWVDVVFSANLGPDTTAPSVTAHTPASGASGISSSASLTATFSEAMDAASISGSSFELRDAANGLVAANVAYNASTRIATLTPVNALAASTTYTATIKGGVSGAKDSAGNPLANDLSWSFTTAAAAATGTVTIWPATATPAVLSDSDTGAVELGVKFRSDVDGLITGIRFYKGPANTGSHVGNLWNANGTLLATAQFNSETASGWQQVDFAAPVAITANTVYVASYHAPAGGYSANNAYFASSGVDNGVLHALRDGESGGNGVYAYSGSSTFPSSTFNASNYWVDVVFSANLGPDTTAPSVTAHTPASGATGVSASANVIATFSEAMDAASISGSSFELRDAANGLVAANVAYNASTRIATLTPSVPLSLSASYTATVKGGAVGLRDLAGNALVADVSWSFTVAAVDPCAANPVATENCKPGNPASEWDIVGVGDTNLQGYATQISVNRGESVLFKVKSDAANYRFDIYRLGYYGGMGARKVGTVQPTAALPQNQPACLNDGATGLIDCGNWAISGSWQVPTDAVSGIYFAKLVRSDTGGASHIVFVVRDDARPSDILFQTSDTTWQAYNDYGGNSLYVGSPVGRAYKVSYNRPFNTRVVDGGQDWLFNAEYPAVRWLEANGYDVSYSTGIDSDRRGALIRNSKIFLSVGHDEYWSGDQRANVEAARAAGVNLAFMSGNEIFWKTRWENSIDGSGTPYRTLVSYKETKADAVIDPLGPAVWTGTWRDPRFSPPGDGGRPENALTGTLFMVNEGATTSITVPAEDGKLRFWRNTSLATLPVGSVATLPFGTLGYEWDVDADNGFRPAGLMRLSTTTVPGAPVLQDFGSTYGSETATHSLTLYKHASGALVFGAGTVQWVWGLDAVHDRAGTPADIRIQQSTVNLLADMGAQPRTLQAGLVAGSASTDAASPLSSILTPANGGIVQPGVALSVAGSASDTGGGVVAGMEVSVDGGTTWHRAEGRETWTYSWTPTSTGQVTILSRAVDDSGNLELANPGVTVTIGQPDSTAPAVPSGLTSAGGVAGNSVSWAPNSEPDLSGYNVFRSAAATGPFAKLNSSLVAGTGFTDVTAPVGTSYYRISAVDTSGNESAPSATVSALRPDTTPPAVPVGLSALGASSGNSLSWTSNTESDLAGYNVHRSSVATGPFVKINAALVVGASYTDTLAPVGASHYRVSAVDSSGNESAQSATASATRPEPLAIAPVAGVGALASGSGVDVSWAASTTSGVSGYNVYRATSADGPFTKLNFSLVGGLSFEDTLAPSGSSFYRVTAVDSSGIESASSSAVGASMATANRILNPGFELDANGDTRPDSWTSSTRFTRSNLAGRSGAFSGRHFATSNPNYTISQTINGLTSGAAYTFAGWVRIPITPDAFGFSIQVRWRNGTTNVRTDTVATYSSATTDWTKASATLSAPAGTTNAQILMVANSLNATIYVDDLAFR